MQTPAINGHPGFLSAAQNIHPPDGFGVADLPQVDLGCLQIRCLNDVIEERLQLSVAKVARWISILPRKATITLRCGRTTSYGEKSLATKS
jgi:hypothetical protein